MSSSPHLEVLSLMLQWPVIILILLWRWENWYLPREYVSSFLRDITCYFIQPVLFKSLGAMSIYLWKKRHKDGFIDLLPRLTNLSADSAQQSLMDDLAFSNAFLHSNTPSHWTDQFPVYVCQQIYNLSNSKYFCLEDTAVDVMFEGASDVQACVVDPCNRSTFHLWIIVIEGYTV